MTEITIQGGYISPLFITDSEQRVAELTGPYILIYEGSLSDPRPLVPILEAVIQSGKPLCVVAHNVQGEALGLLVTNRRSGCFLVVAVRCQAKAQLDALANATGGIVVSEDLGLPLECVTLDMLGRANRVLIKKDQTTVLGGAGTGIEEEIVATSGKGALVSDRTGAPGHPTSSHLVQDECRKRINAGTAEPVLNHEAEYLATWLRKTHPTLAPMTRDTIANRIRVMHRHYRETTK